MVRDEEAPAILEAAIDAYAGCAWTAGRSCTRPPPSSGRDWAGRKLGKAQAPIRVAVTGRTVGPPLFESLVVLGRDEVLRRLGAAPLDRLRSQRHRSG